MVTVFANNMVMVAENGTSTEITTDPVPMGGNDRVTGVGNVHYIIEDAGGTASITVTLEASNDGTSWIEVGGGSWGTLNATGSKRLGSLTAPYAFVRVKFAMAVAGTGTERGFMCFDLHCTMDHA